MKGKEMYRAILAIAVTFSFIMPVVVVAEDQKSLNNRPNNLDFTHTVFAEFVTETTCTYCKYSHAALKTIYASGDYPFYYVSLVCDKNSKANNRAVFEYNRKAFPTVFFDGGYLVNLGGGTGNEAQYRSSITTCGERSVPDIDMDLNVSWQGGTEMDITVSVDNNKDALYDGTLRVYITEIESSMGWYDSAGLPYTFPFLDYAFNEYIVIPAGDTWSDSTSWNGDNHGYPTITSNNILVIAAMFNDDWHQGYADPPSGNPFNAYYVDETVAATPTGGNIPPDKPTTPEGPTSGIEDVEYTYTSSTTDPEGDDIFYLFDWDDGTDSGWIGPYHSGISVEASHAWNHAGNYDIKVRGKDIHGAESPWSDSSTINIGDVPLLEIGNISGGLFKVSAVIKNTGSAEATDVKWSITLTGGIILLGKNSTGTMLNIPAGGEVTVTSDLILGLGNTRVTVTAEKPGVSSDTKEQEALVFLCFIRT